MDLQLPSGTVTFLTTDIVGFSELFEREPDRVRSITRRQADLIGGIAGENGGVVFKLVGDAVWAAFSTAPSAVACAIRASKAIRDEPVLAGVQLRMALLTGEATPVGGDYLERVLNRCSRLCAKARGDQILVGGSTYELTRTDFQYRPLGEQELRGVPNESVWELCLDRPDGPSAPSSTRPRFRHLPEEEGPFVGRETELSDVTGLLLDPQVRLVTVTGMGGIGKTRLCTEVARGLLHAFVDGVCLVPCDGIVNDEELIAAVASGLELDLDDCSVGSLADGVGDCGVLLLLDSFERLVRYRGVIDELLSRSSRLKLLVSSRTAIGLMREYEFTLGPMLTQRAGGSEADAATLFWNAAGHVAPKLRSTKAHQRTVGLIVEALEGVPLAILLAATRLSHMTLEELLGQIRARRLKTLRRPPVGQSDRHMTLQRVIGDSFDLLSQTELQLMVDLACLHGFFMEDALAVVGSEDAREGIADLRSHSLLTAQTMGPKMRFRILDTVREYIEENLGDRIRTEVRQRQAAHYARIAAETRSLAGSGGWKRANALFWLEMGNFRLAIRWAAEANDLALLEALARSLSLTLADTGCLDEFELLVGALATHGETVAVDVLAEVKGHQGTLARRAGAKSEARRHWKESAELWNSSGNWDRSADLFTDLAETALNDGDLSAAQADLARFNEIRAEHPLSASTRASGRALEARIALLKGDRVEAEQAAEDAVRLSDQTASGHNSIYVMWTSGKVLFETGRLEPAEELLLRAVRLSVEGNYASAARRTLIDLADAYRALRRLDREAACLAIAQRIVASVSQDERQRLNARIDEFRGRTDPAVFATAADAVSNLHWVQATTAALEFDKNHAGP